MKKATIWHNPKCSKSRATLELLVKSDINVTKFLYLITPPTEKELSDVIQKLNTSASKLIRKGEDLYTTLNLSKETDEQILIKTMIKHPILIERPIVLVNEQAAIGRPIENVINLIKI